MVAALLDLDEGAGAADEFGDEVGGGFAGLHDVGDGGLGVGRPARGLQLFGVAEDAGDAGERRPAFGGDLGGAAGDDDLRLRAFAMGAADGLAGLALGLAGDGAGVDDDGVGEGGGVAAHHLALIGVQAAAEGEDIDGHVG